MLTLAACTTIPSSEHPLSGQIWDPITSLAVDREELMRRVAGADIILLGETHDNAEHHRLQLEVLQNLVATNRRPALLMEQFDVGQQGMIDDVMKEGGDLSVKLRGWDPAQYKPILDAAQRAGLALRAANLPREQMRPVAREGYAALSAGEATRLGLESTWDDARERFLSRVIESSHCGKISPQLRDGLVRAQRLRDATMADVALRQDGGKILFILGRGHARRDIGVPTYIAARSPAARVISIGMVEVQQGRDDPALYETERVGKQAPHDLLWFTPRAERPDPCLAFGK